MLLLAAQVVREAYPDVTAFDPASQYYDDSSSRDNPKWWQVRSGVCLGSFTCTWSSQASCNAYNAVVADLQYCLRPFKSMQSAFQANGHVVMTCVIHNRPEGALPSVLHQYCLSGTAAPRRCQSEECSAAALNRQQDVRQGVAGHEISDTTVNLDIFAKTV